MKNKETLEEAAKKYRKTTPNQMFGDELGFIDGAKWQAERMYSEEDMVNFALFLEIHLPMKPRKTHRQLLEQFNNYETRNTEKHTRTTNG
jgi:hypothetical protein